MRSRRHALGQHFLKDQTVVDRILKMSEKRLDASGARSMVEVGPGRMAITYGLAEMASSKGVPLHLVERDRKLEPVLKEGLQGLEADLRFFDAATETMKELINELAASGKGPVLFVSNLPYSASSQILARLCEVREHLGGGHGDRSPVFDFTPAAIDFNPPRIGDTALVRRGQLFSL
jgi:16S rRNA A1518/A1519 N6-dimethyltransferase RsmA/KsgA/DIM1 with predicted DNA glycosylase/AP lyase activity